MLGSTSHHEIASDVGGIGVNGAVTDCPEGSSYVQMSAEKCKTFNVTYLYGWRFNELCDAL